MTPGFDIGAGERRLAEYTQRVAAIQEQAEETQERLRTLRTRTESPDRSVTVEMAPGGRLEQLTLSPQAMQHGPEELAALITETVRRAHGEVAEQMQATLRPLIGDSPAMEFLRDHIEVAQQGPPQPPESAPPADSPLRSDAPRPQRPVSRDTDNDDEGFGSVWEDR